MSDDLDLALTAALAGARLAMDYFARFADIGREWKPDGGLVTEADRAVETTIARVLTAARPGDALLGEEGGQREEGGRREAEGQREEGARRWIVDPIDGTAIFARGDDRWLVLVALEVGRKVEVAVAVVPAQRRIWWAERGAGAFVADLSENGPTGERRVHVDRRTTADVAGSRLGLVPEPALVPADQPLVAGLTAVTAPRPWATHPALLVASGGLDLAVQTRGHVWDYAAPSLIVTEAGGRFSGFDGGDHPHTGPALYSAHPDLHRTALANLAG